jgi:hypothetical protein
VVEAIAIAIKQIHIGFGPFRGAVLFFSFVARGYLATGTKPSMCNAIDCEAYNTGLRAHSVQRILAACPAWILFANATGAEFGCACALKNECCNPIYGKLE